jgi:hypothetical protein
LPEKVRNKAPAAPNSYWADPRLNDVPICFLSDADTTGGNSGSPIINGKGELVGLNFDRVWENVAGDFGYDKSRSRNIGVDVRYLAWMLDRVDNATSLLTELSLADYRSAAARRERAGTPHRSAASTEPPSKPPSSCGCRAVGSSAPHWSGSAVLALMWAWRAARRRSSR